MRKDKGLFIGFLIGSCLASLYFVVSARSKEPSVLDEVLADFVTMFLVTKLSVFTMISELGDKIGIGIVALLCYFGCG